MAGPKNPGDKEEEMKKLIEEVRKMKGELDILKLGPTITHAVRDIAKKAGLQTDYTVTYSVYSQQYSVIV